MKYCRLYVATIATLAAISTICRAEFLLTAELSPTLGLDGFSTYRITATSDLGNVVAFDFTSVAGNGVLGPVHQVQPFGQPRIFTGESSPFGTNDPSQDTLFLLPSSDVVSIHTSESEESLHGAFALIGDRQLSIGNRVPFLQVATPDPAAVTLKGAFVVRRPDDVLPEEFIDIRLSDILVAPAPQWTVLPPPAPIEPPAPPPVEVPLPPPPVAIEPPPAELLPPSPPEVNDPPANFDPPPVATDPPPASSDPPLEEPLRGAEVPPPPTYELPYIVPIDRPYITICDCAINFEELQLFPTELIELRALQSIDYPLFSPTRYLTNITALDIVPFDGVVISSDFTDAVDAVAMETNATAPEPSTLALFGLAMVGLVSSVRRRG